MQRLVVRYRPTERQPTAVVQQEQNAPISDVMRMVFNGRDMHVAYDENGLHARRRAKQIRGAFKRSFTIRVAPPLERPIVRHRYPWWWS